MSSSLACLCSSSDFEDPARTNREFGEEDPVMEQDFLGIRRSDSHLASSKAGARGGSAVQWPFSNKSSAIQHFMFNKASQEERPRSHVVDNNSSFRYHPVAAAFDPNHKVPHALASQRLVSLDRHGSISQYHKQAYQLARASPFDASNNQFNVRQRLALSKGSPLQKIPTAHTCPNAAVTSPRQHQPLRGGTALSPVAPVEHMPKHNRMTCQLTIFYEGRVLVFDHVPQKKAQEIMLLASKRPNKTSNGVNPTTKAPQPPAPLPVPNQILMPAQICCSGGVTPSLTDSSTNNETALGLNTASDMPRAVPQARKASLARFLEKRMERLTSAMPYSCKISAENGSAGFESCCNMSSTSSSADIDINLSSYQRESWFVADPKSSIDSADSPSTKLSI